MIPNTVSSHVSPPRRSGRLWPALAIVFAFAFAVLALYRPVMSRFGFAAYNSGDWYAVHTADGNTFFGHIGGMSGTVIKLTSAHYLESYKPETPPQTSSGQSVNVESVPQTLYNVVPRGSDRFIATDHTVLLERRSVVFWEKLTNASEIVKTIEKEAGQ